MQITANTLISSIFQQKPATNIPDQTLDMDITAEELAAIEPGSGTNQEETATPSALAHDHTTIYPNQTAQTLFNTQESASKAPEIEAEENTAAQEFLDYMNKSSTELWRERILESLGLTEEALAELPPEDRLAAEEKIERLMREKIEEEAERAEKENGKTKEMTDTEQQQQASHQINAKHTALNNDLSGLKSSDPKITHMLDLTAETTQAYASAQQKSDALEHTRQEKRQRPTEQKI